MSVSQEELLLAEVGWNARIFAEIDLMVDEDLDPTRGDAAWVAGRQLQAELNQAMDTIAKLKAGKK